MKVPVRPIISCAKMEGTECTWTEVEVPCCPQLRGKQRLERSER